MDYFSQSVLLGIILSCTLVDLSAQKEYCATIDKYDILSKKESSHIAMVIVNETLLVSIKWIDNTVINEDYFGHAVFYNNTATFNDTNQKQYRITLKESANNCFEKLITYQCQSKVVNDKICGKKTNCKSLRCWAH